MKKEHFLYPPDFHSTYEVIQKANYIGKPLGYLKAYKKMNHSNNANAAGVE